jgi:hypothetical protein
MHFQKLWNHLRFSEQHFGTTELRTLLQPPETRSADHFEVTRLSKIKILPHSPTACGVPRRRYHKSEMIAPLEKTGNIYRQPVSRAAPLIDEHADYPAAAQHGPADRKLRNLILLANTIAWIAIFALVRYALF